MALLPLPYQSFGDNILTFAFTPTLPNFSWTIAGTVYTSNQPKAAVNTALTFTATAVAPWGSGRRFVKYEWDFGDGVKGYGSSVTHTYSMPNPLTRARCCVTDNFGVKICVGQQLYLMVPPPSGQVSLPLLFTT